MIRIIVWANNNLINYYNTKRHLQTYTDFQRNIPLLGWTWRTALRAWWTTWPLHHRRKIVVRISRHRLTYTINIVWKQWHLFTSNKRMNMCSWQTILDMSRYWHIPWRLNTFLRAFSFLCTLSHSDHIFYVFYITIWCLLWWMPLICGLSTEREQRCCSAP